MSHADPPLSGRIIETDRQSRSTDSVSAWMILTDRAQCTKAATLWDLASDSHTRARHPTSAQTRGASSGYSVPQGRSCPTDRVWAEYPSRYSSLSVLMVFPSLIVRSDPRPSPFPIDFPGFYKAYGWAIYESDPAYLGIGSCPVPIVPCHIYLGPPAGQFRILPHRVLPSYPFTTLPMSRSCLILPCLHRILPCPWAIYKSDPALSGCRLWVSSKGVKSYPLLHTGCSTPRLAALVTTRYGGFLSDHPN